MIKINKKLFISFSVILIILFFHYNVYALEDMIVKNVKPIYDENSGVNIVQEGEEYKVIFNDKNQSVKF